MRMNYSWYHKRNDGKGNALGINVSNDPKEEKPTCFVSWAKQNDDGFNFKNAITAIFSPEEAASIIALINRLILPGKDLEKMALSFFHSGEKSKTGVSKSISISVNGPIPKYRKESDISTHGEVREYRMFLGCSANKDNRSIILTASEMIILQRLLEKYIDMHLMYIKPKKSPVEDFDE